MTVVAEEPKVEELLQLYERMALIRATEKAAHVSAGDPVNGFRISPRRSVLPEVATQKLWPVITPTRPPGPAPADTPTRHGSSTAGSATTRTSPPPLIA